MDTGRARHLRPTCLSVRSDNGSVPENSTRVQDYGAGGVVVFVVCFLNINSLFVGGGVVLELYNVQTRSLGLHAPRMSHRQSPPLPVIRGLKTRSIPSSSEQSLPLYIYMHYKRGSLRAFKETVQKEYRKTRHSVFPF